MAYNRDWDRGKDNRVDNQGSWGADARPHVRHRDEDYTADPKRRKFNNGGYQGYDNPQGYDDGHHGGQSHNRHSDYNHQQYQEHGYEDRSRGGGGGAGFPKKRLQPSEPSPHVIFLGLDPDFTEADLQAFLTSHGCNPESVTIIRDRSSGTCMFTFGFGFAQFASTEHAKAFVDPQFPFMQVPPPASHGASATATFYKAIESGAQHNGRRVKIDYSQSAAFHDKGRVKANTNDGTRDIGNTQSPVLLFRGLDPLSGPQAIYQAMLNSSGPGKQGAKGMRRIILIKDKVTMASFGFAFVEFVDVQSASAVLAATMSPQIHPNGFRISDRPVAASFAHPYSFQPVTDFLQRDESCLQGTSSLGGAETPWVRYWDESSTVSVLEFKVEEPAKPVEKAKEKKEKKKKDETKHTIPTASLLPILTKPVTLSLNKGPVKIGLGSSNAPKTLASGVLLDDSADDPEEPHTEPNKPIAVKRVAPLISSKKTVNNITKWNQVQEELHVDPYATPVSDAALAAKVADKAEKPVSTEPSPAPEDVLEFADINALTCLLCSRQLKSLDLLTRHSLSSDLHKKNLRDKNLQEVARQKLVARKAMASSSKEQDEAPKYRDRASERRTLFNQPDAPVPEASSTSASAKRKFADAPPRPPSPPPPPVNPGRDESNVGNKLLKMMGWKVGTGLGADGEGRTDPIETAVYAQGVGLGASKGKDIGKYTEGYSGYIQMAQESARERYGD
ncbi:hypothetical protein FA15DRAFT_755080 [Coprinopsis marcescibilis]|uniref:G-patch domain-containing protein n=1 Tax=Coprinopsis marcescibilis TaxID=230819 RepID=A0A5C3L1J5_COPMA|nr:hypothetical protein FA15DRAFT_755080 [Coprinopsis marcescibilis]